MCGSRDNIYGWKWRLMRAANDQTGNVRHVSHRDRARVAGDGGDALKINGPRIGRVSSENNFRLMFNHQFFDNVIIKHLGFWIKRIINKVIILSRKIHWRAMCQVSAVIKFEGHYRISALQKREIDSKVRWTTGKGLHVHVITVRA